MTALGDPQPSVVGRQLESVVVRCLHPEVWADGCCLLQVIRDYSECPFVNWHATIDKYLSDWLVKSWDFAQILINTIHPIVPALAQRIPI